ncbi:MAG: FAD-dependent oxidoreductase, partial [Actinomycetes bacterium]
MTSSSRWHTASPIPFWLDDPDRPAPRPALTGATSVDTVVVGGGFTGLWAAL